MLANLYNYYNIKNSIGYKCNLFIINNIKLCIRYSVILIIE